MGGKVPDGQAICLQHSQGPLPAVTIGGYLDYVPTAARVSDGLLHLQDGHAVLGVLRIRPTPPLDELYVWLGRDRRGHEHRGVGTAVASIERDDYPRSGGNLSPVSQAVPYPRWQRRVTVRVNGLAQPSSSEVGLARLGWQQRLEASR